MYSARGEMGLSYVAYRFLVYIGFAPSNPDLLPTLFKVFWILCITRFAWVQVIGLALYVGTAPLWVLWEPFFGWLRRKKGIAAPKPPPQEEAIPPDFPLSSFVITSLLAWFVLYGNSSSRGPLIGALVLTGCLFAICIARASIYTMIINVRSEGRLSRIANAPVDYLLRIMKQIALGEIKTDDQLMKSLAAQKWMLRLFRRISVYFHGKAGMRRAALMVFLQYMMNLTILGLLTVLFWALVIKLTNSPSIVSISGALWASASHVIPGIPDSEGIKVSRAVQAGISLTAWMIFVLYAGPVASMFPMYQEQCLKQVSEFEASLRTGRRLLYRWTDALTQLCEKTRKAGDSLGKESDPDAPVDSC
jgi:hypothetical protein